MDKSKKYKLEADLTRDVKKLLDTFPKSALFYWKASDRFQNGISDILICYKGIMIACELKAESNKPSPHQELFIRKVVQAGGVGGVCYTLSDVLNLLEVAEHKIK